MIRCRSEVEEAVRMISSTCSSKTPIDTEKKLRPEGSSVSDPTLYRSLAGSLQYLTFTRPDLSYAVQQLCLYMHDPREPHLNAMKRVLRLRADLLLDTVFFLVANAVAETSWIRNLLRELHTPLFTATLVYCDNVSLVYMSANPLQHQRTKHIEIDIHFLRDKVAADDYLSSETIRYSEFLRDQKKLTDPTSFDGYRQLRLHHAAWDKAKRRCFAHAVNHGHRYPMKSSSTWWLMTISRKLKAMFSKQAEQELLQTVREFYTCKQEEGQSVSTHVLKMKGYIDNLERLVNKTPPPPKKDNQAKDAICHQCGEVGHWRRNYPVYLTELMKKKKLSQGASASVSKDNLVYFMAVPRDGIFEIDMSCYNTNDSSMYAITNKRAKINLDSSLLWHCRLGHISKKRIEKLQHDGLLNSIDIESLGKCVSCLSGKMARKPYSHQVERAKDLLGLIHTDVCGPFRIVSRQGASYFVTFTDDFSRYGYVYLLKHKHEVFETFKSFWDYALESAARILNMVPTKKVDKTPYEIWHGQAPKLSYLRIPKGNNRIFSTAHLRTKYLFARKRVHLSLSSWILKASGSVEDLELIQEEDTNPSEDTSLNHEEDDQEIDEPQSDINPIRRSTRTRHPTDRLCLYIDTEEHELGDLGEPANYKAALLDSESKKWLGCENVENAIHEKTMIMMSKPPSSNGQLSEEDYIEQPDGDAAYILGINIYRDRFQSGYNLVLNQSAYIEKILKRFYMENSKRGTIPMQEKIKLSKSQGASTPAEK
ncbi:zinc finger, CCHC-type containing protein [Tanacetum coccineum]